MSKKVLILLTCLVLAQISISQTQGPEKGSLVVVGGGGATDAILEKFIDLAGGKEELLVVIPTAAGGDEYDQDTGIADRLRDLGATDVVVWHTNDREQADDASFTEPLTRAGGVWFGGGRQWRLVDAYGGTLSERRFNQVLERGGVIGGSSAGASIQGSYLVRGDTESNQVMMGDHEVGFGFIKNIAIDQHVLVRNRHFDMFTILDEKPGLLGIGIDEKTAMVVEGDVFEVLGPSYVLVYDQQFWSREGARLKKLPKANRRFYFLREGDRYDMKERKKL